MEYLYHVKAFEQLGVTGFMPCSGSEVKCLWLSKIAFFLMRMTKTRTVIISLYIQESNWPHMPGSCRRANVMEKLPSEEW